MEVRAIWFKGVLLGFRNTDENEDRSEGRIRPTYDYIEVDDPYADHYTEERVEEGPCSHQLGGKPVTIDQALEIARRELARVERDTSSR